MKGDFSRITFDPKKHYSKVLQQQGRVQLDADWNEMVDIHCHDLRNVMKDLIGSYGGPIYNCGFQTNAKATNRGLKPGDFFIGKGRYYVDGIACENACETTYCTQPDFSPKPLQQGKYLVYLDVWERHITAVEDPEILEVALDGLDTSTRMKVVWQVRTHRLNRSMTCAEIKRCWIDLTHKWQPKHRGVLCAKTEMNPSNTGANRGYIGLENHLYRVEIHKAGSNNEKSTFKWSRDNGTVAYLIHSIHVDDSSDITIVNLEKPSNNISLSLQLQDWVEILDEQCILEGRPGLLLQVIEIDQTNSQLTLQGLYSGSICNDQSRPCLIRRWDHKQGNGSQIQDGAVVIKEELDDNSWLKLENGIWIRFDPTGQYSTGDYWLIPARAINGSIEWPNSRGNPLAQPPVGIYHHFAPLSIIKVDSQGKINVRDCRLTFRIKSQSPVVVSRRL